jgi:phosphoserine phosphatase
MKAPLASEDLQTFETWCRSDVLHPFFRNLPSAQNEEIILFDADGTLWHGDISESFTRWMMDANTFSSRLWPSYENLNQLDPAAACFHIAQFYHGHRPDDIDTHIQNFWHASHWGDLTADHWLKPILTCVRVAADRGYRIWIVSGTPAPVLAPLFHCLPVEKVLGLELEHDPWGLYSGCTSGIPTVGQAKVNRVRDEGGGAIALAVGNSLSDAGMLGMAKQAWAINPDEQLKRWCEINRWHWSQSII